jgi:YVTN family beta-propeller protein
VKSIAYLSVPLSLFFVSSSILGFGINEDRNTYPSKNMQNMNLDENSLQQSIVYTPDGSKAYITNRADYTISVFDTETQVSAIIATNIAPSTFISMMPDGQKAYVGNNEGRMFSAIDVTTDFIYPIFAHEGWSSYIFTETPDGRKIFSFNTPESHVTIDVNSFKNDLTNNSEAN